MSKTVVRGGTVLTMDPSIGNLATGDVLIEDDKIAAVEADLGVRRHPPPHLGSGDPRLRAQRHA